VSTVELARSFVLRKQRGLPYSVLDMPEDRRPVLVETAVGRDRFLDVVADRGCSAAGVGSGRTGDRVPERRGQAR
jgi:hypothetical protein